MVFKPNRKFKKKYDRIYKKDPAAANVLLLLCELADERGQVQLGPLPEEELQRLLIARFEDPKAYQLRGPRQ